MLCGLDERAKRRMPGDGVAQRSVAGLDVALIVWGADTFAEQLAAAALPVCAWYVPGRNSNA